MSIHKIKGVVGVGLRPNEHSSKCGTEWMKNWDLINNYMVPQQLVYICFKMWDQNEKKLQNIVEQKTRDQNWKLRWCCSTTPGEMWDQNVLKMLDTNVFKMWDQNVLKMLDPNVLKMWDQNVLKMWDQNVFKMWDQKWKPYIITFCSLICQFFCLQNF
jgi:hypothetical protein